MLFCNSIFQHPFLHFLYVIPLALPFKAVSRFVPLVATGSRMSLWLRKLLYMKNGRYMCIPYFLQTILKYLAQACIVPAFYTININAIRIIFLLQSSQCCRNRALGSLIFGRY